MKDGEQSTEGCGRRLKGKSETSKETGYSGQEAKKNPRERGKQASDEMPVMSAQVLMSATALVDTPPGNKPMT